MECTSLCIFWMAWLTWLIIIRIIHRQDKSKQKKKNYMYIKCNKKRVYATMVLYIAGYLKPLNGSNVVIIHLGV